MNYPIIYYRYSVLGILQEYRFPPLHQPTLWGTRVVGDSHHEVLCLWGLLVHFKRRFKKWEHQKAPWIYSYSEHTTKWNNSLCEKHECSQYYNLGLMTCSTLTSNHVEPPYRKPIPQQAFNNSPSAS